MCLVADSQIPSWITHFHQGCFLSDIKHGKTKPNSQTPFPIKINEIKHQNMSAICLQKNIKSKPSLADFQVFSAQNISSFTSFLQFFTALSDESQTSINPNGTSLFLFPSFLTEFSLWDRPHQFSSLQGALQLCSRMHSQDQGVSLAVPAC